MVSGGALEPKLRVYAEEIIVWPFYTSFAKGALNA